MSQVYIFNSAKVQLDVKGDDGKTYFLPPRRVSKLPAGISVDGPMRRELKFTKS